MDIQSKVIYRRLDELQRRIDFLESQNMSLRAMMNHVAAASSSSSRQMAGSAVDAAGVSDHCIDQAYVGTHTDDDGISGVKMGPLRLVWNEDDGVWEGAGDSLSTSRALASAPVTTNPAASAADSLVDDAGSERRAHLSNLCFVTEDGLALNADVLLVVPGDTSESGAGQLALVNQKFNSAPLGDGKTDVMCPVCVLI